MHAAESHTRSAGAAATTVIMPRPAKALPLLAVYPIALGAMLPWPLLAAAALIMLDALEKWWELAIVLGGVTGLVMIPLAVFVDIPNAVYAAAMVLVWLLTWLAVPPLIRSQWKTRSAMFATIIGLSVFSLMQAAVGAMMIVGKSV